MDVSLLILLDYNKASDCIIEYNNLGFISNSTQFCRSYTTIYQAEAKL